MHCYSTIQHLCEGFAINFYFSIFFLMKGWFKKVFLAEVNVTFRKSVKKHCVRYLQSGTLFRSTMPCDMCIELTLGTSGRAGRGFLSSTKLTESPAGRACESAHARAADRQQIRGTPLSWA